MAVRSVPPPVTSTRELVTAADIEIAYGERVIAQNVNLTVTAGQFVSIVGRSGCGKTSLLRVIAGLLRPRSGTLVQRRDGHGRPEVSMVFQQDNLFAWLSAERNVSFALESVGVPRREALQRAHQELARVGLEASAGMRPKRLSGGMRQRVNLARALVTDAPVILMDEPFSGLDYLTRHAMQELTSGLVEDDRAVIFVTHDLEEAVFLSDRIVVMSPEERTVIASIDVPGGRPRPAESRRSPEFQELVARLQDLVVGDRGISDRSADGEEASRV